MPFGKRNNKKSALPAPPQSGVSDLNRALFWIVSAASAVALLALALPPKLRSVSWWFGPHPATPYLVAIATGFFMLLAYSNLRAARQRRSRHEQRTAAVTAETGSPTPVWPDWCTEYGQSGSSSGSDESGGDCGGGDGGGD